MQVASFLKSRGFAHVANIAGGINAWSAELDPSIPRY
jgi:rhodanese-related sulfurtransferase